QELRAVLGDDPAAPRFLETIGRQGYRFIAPLHPIQPVRSLEQFGVRSLKKVGPCTPYAELRDSPLVGRETELAQLHEWLAKAQSGERQTVFVTGEPGIGKTTLVDTFLAQLGARDWGLGTSSSSLQAPSPKPQVPSPQVTPSPSHPFTLSFPLIARGQCVEHYGAGEAYLPVFEALGRLCREPEGERCLQVLRHHAPLWLLQMPTLLSEAEFALVQRRVQGATQERMLRELAEAIEAYTAERPLLLVLEDLHWSDVSTLELIAYLARRREPARLLVIGTYRPVEGLGKEHPLRAMSQELHLHHDCMELPLEFLTEAAVGQYLLQRFGVGETSVSSLQDVARIVHQRTEGNPLFMVNVVDFLLAQGVIVQNGAQEIVQGEVGQAAVGVPDNIRQMIERQIEHLSVAEQRVLAVASVAGGEFSAAAVAAGLGTDVWEVEEQCTGLVRRGRVLHPWGASEWPDGTVTTRYRFVHA
ncbi:MAG: AAA family ATPase, partial [Candidatus Binatia bacterium]